MKIVFGLLLVLGVSLAVPITYDQRQDGEMNVRADLKNIVVVALFPKLNGGIAPLYNILSKTIKARNGNDIRRQNLEAEVELDPIEPADPFIKSKSTYHVDISEAKSNAAQSKSAYPARTKLTDRKQIIDSPVPDVIPVKDNRYVMGDRNGRILEIISLNDNPEDAIRITSSGPSESREIKDSGLLLLGASEQCGPDGYRDDKGVCRYLTTK